MVRHTIDIDDDSEFREGLLPQLVGVRGTLTVDPRPIYLEIESDDPDDVGAPRFAAHPETVRQARNDAGQKVYFVKFANNSALGEREYPADKPVRVYFDSDPLRRSNSS